MAKEFLAIFILKRASNQSILCYMLASTKVDPTLHLNTLSGRVLRSKYLYSRADPSTGSSPNHIARQKCISFSIWADTCKVVLGTRCYYSMTQKGRRLQNTSQWRQVLFTALPEGIEMKSYKVIENLNRFQVLESIISTEFIL